MPVFSRDLRDRTAPGRIDLNGKLPGIHFYRIALERERANKASVAVDLSRRGYVKTAAAGQEGEQTGGQNGRRNFAFHTLGSFTTGTKSRLGCSFHFADDFLQGLLVYVQGR